MVELINKILKKKHIFKISNSHVVIIPDTWLRALDWVPNTNLIMSIHADDKKIIISEDSIQKVKFSSDEPIPDEELERLEVDDEKISDIESV